MSVINSYFQNIYFSNDFARACSKPDLELDPETYCTKVIYLFFIFLIGTNYVTHKGLVAKDVIFETSFNAQSSFL